VFAKHFSALPMPFFESHFSFDFGVGRTAFWTLIFPVVRCDKHGISLLSEQNLAR